MVIVNSFTEPSNYNHWDLPPLSGYIYKNLLSPKRFDAIKKEVEYIANDSTSKNSFLQNVNIINFNGQNLKLGYSFANIRAQNPIYDLNFEKEYWYQTKDSIYDWGLEVIRNTVSINFWLFIQTMLKLEPFNTKEFLPYRLHINYLPNNTGLALHIDSNHALYNDDLTKVDAYSLTFYLQNHIKDMGGELFSINGYTYNPEENTGIAINGHQVPHAVTFNQMNQVRLAFTTRWAKIEHLYLPGSPDKNLWKQDHL